MLPGRTFCFTTSRVLNDSFRIRIHFFFSQPAFLKLYFYLLYRALAAQDDLCPTLAVSSMTEGRSSATHALGERGQPTNLSRPWFLICRPGKILSVAMRVRNICKEPCTAPGSWRALNKLELVKKGKKEILPEFRPNAD